MDVTLTDIPAALTHVLKRVVLNYQYRGAHYVAVSLFDADSADDDDYSIHTSFMHLHNGRWTYPLSGMNKRVRKHMLEHFTKAEFVELQRYLTVQAHAHFDQFSTRA